MNVRTRKALTTIAAVLAFAFTQVYLVSAGPPQRVITALLLAAQNVLENSFLKELELRAIAKEARFVDG